MTPNIIVKPTLSKSIPVSLHLEANTSLPLMQPQMTPATNIQNNNEVISRYNLKPRKMLERIKINLVYTEKSVLPCIDNPMVI